MRAMVGTRIHEYLAARRGASGSIDLDFRTFGLIRHRFPVQNLFAVAAEIGAGGARGLSQITGSADQAAAQAGFSLPTW